MNATTNSGSCSGLTHFQASNSGPSVARSTSLSVPVNRIANHFWRLPRSAAHHGLGDLVRHLVVKPASALGEDHRSVGADFRPQLAQRAWRGVSPTSDMAQAIVQRSERYQIRA